MISPTLVRKLDLAQAAAHGRPAHLSAASGLVCVGSWLYVVADDELHLGVFRGDSDQPGELVRLFDGALPAEATSRKNRKPDIEAIAYLPDGGRSHRGSLLVLGSGSHANRQRGAILRLDDGGAVDGVPRVVDLSPIFAPLGRKFPALNIEGAVVVGDELRLLQRGNKADPNSAVIRYRTTAFLAALGADAREIEPLATDLFDLGSIDGIPLCFTDGAALPDGRMVFSAVAENTDNPYDDGRCIGAVLGIIEGDRLISVQRLDRACKVEGVHAVAAGDAIDLLMVTDADDPEVPAELLSARMTDRPHPATASSRDAGRP
jgi:hypothetical protein